MSWSDEEVAKLMADNPELKLDDRVDKIRASLAQKPLVEELNHESARMVVRGIGEKEDRAMMKLGKRHKYNVSAKEDRTYGGIIYDSKKECKYAQELDIRKRAGEIDFWLRQVPFDLPGHSRYFVDFMTFIWFTRTDDTEPDLWIVEYIEIKGRDLPMGRLKRRQVEEIYQIEIKVV